MRRKNVQAFRTDWRKAEGYDMQAWDENFIGSVHEGQQFGFYRMVNGIVDNIKADLSPKLQNAQDEQAIYEFLQNAADSQASDCAVIYDEQYFMVLNNGRAFTDKDLKALLNSFQGTKADKSKAENCGKIGRYGIGFKLAYRLMGKSDGAEELLRDLAGPLLFSWQNASEFEELMAYQKGGYQRTTETAADLPWLLKIILACFPTGLEEEVKDLDYQPQTLFKEAELLELQAFLQRNQEQLSALDLSQGSLFFLKFGPKKHEKLKESLLNIQSGIGYAMNTLKTLNKVVLQDKVIERQSLRFEQFTVLPKTADFERIDPEFAFCPIEIALGFPDDTLEAKRMKQSPSLYQFFPMRNERHNLAYLIHASSFAKITDRTRLDDQGEANIETFKYIAKALQKSLNSKRNKDFEHFLSIYKSLLLSDPSEEYDAELLNQHLYRPNLKYIQQSIPTNKRNFYPKDLVVIKKTALPIDPMQLGIGKEWFYWTEDEHLQREAANSAKLDLKSWGLKELLLQGTPALINSWIESLDEEDYAAFVAELRQIDFDEDFLAQFQYINCFRFSQQGGGEEYLSILDLKEEEQIFLMNAQTLPYKEEIKALGFSVLSFDIQDYAAILEQLQKELDYLSQPKALFQKIAERAAVSTLSAAQKNRLFAFLSSLGQINAEDLRSIPLFANHYQQQLPLAAILPLGQAPNSYLEGFEILELEDNSQLADYYCSAEGPELYQNIIWAYWEQLTEHPSLMQIDQVQALYEQSIALYKQASSLPDLAEKKLVFVSATEGFLPAEKVFYHNSLLEVAPKQYPALRTAVRKLMGLELPDPAILDYLNQGPFKIRASSSHKDWRQASRAILEQAESQPLSPKEKQAVYPILNAALHSLELKKLCLFENQLGQRRPLQELLSSEEQFEPFLLPYQIKEEEYMEDLALLLSAEKDLFNKIIHRNWSELIEQETVLDAPEAFYEMISKYSELANSVKPLIGEKYVFLSKEEGFIGEGIFYHQAMEQVEDYPALVRALESLTPYRCPNKLVLPYLNQRALKTRDAVLGRLLHLEPQQLDKDAVLALQEFLSLAKTPLFKFMYVTAGEGRLYELGRRAKNTPYYLDKSAQKMAAVIKENFGESYKLFPYSLYKEGLDYEGLLLGPKLYKELSRHKNASPELLSAMIVESGNAALQEQVFSKIERIVLKEDRIYDKESFEHQALQIFRNKEAEHAKIRSKVFVEAIEGGLMKLSSISFAPQTTVSIERDGKYQLDVAAISPKHKKWQALTNKLMEQLVDYEAPNSLRRRCFELEELTLEQLYDLLKGDRVELQNAQQLAVVLLQVKRKERPILARNFWVQLANEEWLPLESLEAFYFNAPDYIHPQACLHPERYADLPEILRMDPESSSRQAFEFAGQYIAFQPYLERNRFFAAPLRALQENEPKAALLRRLLEAVYPLWAEQGDPKQSIEIYFGQKQQLGEKMDLSAYLFSPEYALQEEQLPPLLQEYLGEDADSIPYDAEPDADLPLNRLSFMLALGLQGPQSAVVNLRRYLAEGQGETTSQKQINEVQNSHAPLLPQTVRFLAQKELLFSSQDERIFWLRKLYNSLSESQMKGLALPYIQSAEMGEEGVVLQYALGQTEDWTYCYTPSSELSEFVEKYELPVAKLLGLLAQTNKRLFDKTLKYYPLFQADSREELDRESLEETAQEWAAPHYLKWKEEFKQSIFLLQGAIPYTVYFQEEMVKIVRQGDAVFIDGEIYLNSQAENLEEALFAIAGRQTVSEMALLQLLRYKNELNKKEEVQAVRSETVRELKALEEAAIQSPKLEQLQAIKSSEKEAQLSMSFNLQDLPEELLSQLLSLAQNSQLKVKED